MGHGAYPAMDVIGMFRFPQISRSRLPVDHAPTQRNGIAQKYIHCRGAARLFQCGDTALRQCQIYRLGEVQWDCRSKTEI